MNRGIHSLVIGCAVLIGCKSGGPENPQIDGTAITKIEIYYRDFNILSYMPYADEHLVKTHDIALSIAQKKDIERILSALPNGCDSPQEKEDAKENLYALIKLYETNDGQPFRTYRFSRFHFTRSSDSRACRLGDVQRDAIKSLVVQLNSKKN